MADSISLLQYTKFWNRTAFDMKKQIRQVSFLKYQYNKSVFSISISEQTDGTQLLVTMVRPYAGLSADGIQRAVTAVADRISQYLENETVLVNALLRRSKSH